MKLFALALCIAPAFAFAKTYDCQGSAKVTLVNDNGQKEIRTETVRVVIDSSKPSLTATIGTDSFEYNGALDLTGRTDTQVNNGGDITKIHTKLQNNKLEFSTKSTEGGIALSQLLCAGK